MYVQWCVKGIAGPSADGTRTGVSKSDAFDLVRNGGGIVSNWWRNKKKITPIDTHGILTDTALDQHRHQYGAVKKRTPFISLSAGSVERDRLLRLNRVHSAIDTALGFATDNWTRPGALFHCWVIVAPNPAVTVSGVAEAVRDLNVYHGYSDWHLEGEITAKIRVPANQIQRVEWWDGAQSTSAPVDQHVNPDFQDPGPVLNLREAF